VTTDDRTTATTDDSGRSQRAAFRLATVVNVHLRAHAETQGTEEWRPNRDGERTIDTFADDISVGGMRLRLPEILPKGSTVSISMFIDGTELELAATVAHGDADSFGAYAGVSFVRIDNAKSSFLSRYITAEQRRRLPLVPAIYPVRCTFGEGEGVKLGTTEHCSPGFNVLLLHSAAELGRRVSTLVTIDKTEITLTGRIVSSEQTSDLWRTAVELHDLAPAVASRWREILLERRAVR
jgi:hypothetical protein